jgi:pimeloyl-ACP methyl ester carboxylesterase
MSSSDELTFVLVHGAWHDGWCWRPVEDALRARGHRVLSPTLTGLGERSHLLSPDVDVNLHGRDIVNVLRFEDLTDVILVGHSYGGPVISGAADAEPGRIRHLVYLDSGIVENGQALLDRLPREIAEQRVASSIDVDGTRCFPIPPAVAFGVTDSGDTQWLERHLVPQPLKTFQDPIVLSGAVGNGRPSSYIVCTDPVYAPLEASRQWARAAGWPMLEIATGHDAMVTAPAALVDMLESVG